MDHVYTHSDSNVMLDQHDHQLDQHDHQLDQQGGHELKPRVFDHLHSTTCNKTNAILLFLLG